MVSDSERSAAARTAATDPRRHIGARCRDICGAAAEPMESRRSRIQPCSLPSNAHLLQILYAPVMGSLYRLGGGRWDHQCLLPALISDTALRIN